MSKKNVARFIVVLLVCCICCCLNNVFASEWTYEMKSTSNGKFAYIFKIYYNSDWKLDIGSNIKADSLNIANKGDLSLEVLRRIKQGNFNFYKDEIDKILNAYIDGKFLSSYSDGNAPKEAVFVDDLYATWYYCAEEVLAYNCARLRTIICNTESSGTAVSFTKFDTEEWGLKYTGKEKDVQPLEQKFDSLLASWNLWRGVYGLEKIQNLEGADTVSGQTVDNNSSIEETSDENTILGNFEGPGNTSPTTEPTEEKDYHDKGEGWWKDAQSFFNKASENEETDAVNDLVTELSDMIFKIGNMIFMVVTSILGVKYIFGSAEGKSQIKDSLITLIVAALFFYGWEAIKNLLDIQGLLSSSEDMVSAASKIYNTVLFIVNLLAIAGIIWIGVKYMLSSAEGKSQIKTSWGPLILGIIMVYATLKFLTTIITVILGGS